MHRIKRAAAKIPLHSSKQIFEAAGASGVPRTSRCRVLQSLATVHKPFIRPPLTNAHKQKQLHWAEKYTKTNFQTVLFTDECRATLDGPDGWSSGWLVDGHSVPTRLRRQQSGGGVMFWAGIMGTELVGPFRVPEGVKMTSAKYVEFMTDYFLPWYRRKNYAFRNKIIFMHDNAPPHAAKNTSASMAAMGIKGEKKSWCGLHPPLTSILLRTFGASSSKRGWEAVYIQTAALGGYSDKQIQAETVQKNSQVSMDARLVKLLSKKGSYVTM
ncbi:unnamed protein product [Staurois parvus]|uniref:Transposase n=1 Tax=Staurois parvus TaxID=386267 RepID=A0ABN9EEH2_9NEOB|nr:unnamed protein product [Staurois parvus]